MNQQTITDAQIQEYLELTVPLENYFILQIDDDKDSALIGLIENGIAYSIMDDNDERVEVCLDFLRRYGAPVLKTLDAENAYIEEFNKKQSQ